MSQNFHWHSPSQIISVIAIRWSSVGSGDKLATAAISRPFLNTIMRRGQTHPLRNRYSVFRQREEVERERKYTENHWELNTNPNVEH
jgi:hypothetical protein